MPEFMNTNNQYFNHFSFNRFDPSKQEATEDE